MIPFLTLLLLFGSHEAVSIFDIAFDLHMGVLNTPEGEFKFKKGQGISTDGHLVSWSAYSGDLRFRVEVAEAAERSQLELSIGRPQMTCRIRHEDSMSIELLRDGEQVGTYVADDVSPPYRLSMMNRGGAVELLLNGRPVLVDVREAPLGGAPVELRISGGEIRLEHLALDRLPWWGDTVRFADPSAASSRLPTLRQRPVEEFSLLDPGPARIDPEYRLAVRGEEQPLVVSVCGVRPGAEELPLLTQALALSTVRPYLKVRVTRGEDGPEIPGEGPFGPFDISGPDVIVEVDALIGIVGEWPTLTLWDRTGDERILDRTVPGGPMGRGVWARVPEESSRLMLVLDVPGQDPVEYELLMRRGE